MLVGGRAKHAVCLTGLERSFEEIGANVREGVFSMFGGSVEFFGVHPVNSTPRLRPCNGEPLARRLGRAGPVG